MFRMRRSAPRLARLLAALLCILALVAAACGGEEETPAAGDEPVATADEPQSDDAATATDEAEDTATAAAQPETVEEVLAAVEGMEIDERRVELMRMAEAEADEGPVLVYTSMTLMAENLDELRASLAEATGLEMDLYRASGEEVRARLLQEASADVHEADVLETGGRFLEQLAGEGMTAPYDGPYVEALIEGAAQENWDATRLNVYTVAWNTNLVAEGEQPESYQELAEDQWADRLTLEPSDYDWYWSVDNYWTEELGMSEEEADALWQQMADNADFVSGHTSTLEIVGAGEYAVMASAFAPTVERFGLEGVPVAWRPAVQPLFAAPNAASIYSNTQQPASSVLFMDWLFSDAQEIFAENEIFVTRQDLQHPALEGLDVRVIDVETYTPLEPQAMEEYDALAR